MAIPAQVGINEFLANALTSGVSMSNLYEVDFVEFPDKVAKSLAASGFIDSGGALKNLRLLCEEASLPGIMANTATTTGVFQGEGQVNYAHTKAYQDLTLGWTCDANLLPAKFLNAWMKVIFNDEDNTGRVTRLNYPEDYQCKIIKITKAERSKDNTLGRISGIYTLHDVWPYSIQSTPLSYGASTLLKVTAAFYYRRWTFSAK
jgi:hypothetical protein